MRCINLSQIIEKNKKAQKITKKSFINTGTHRIIPLFQKFPFMRFSSSFSAFGHSASHMYTIKILNDKIFDLFYLSK